MLAIKWSAHKSVFSSPIKNILLSSGSLTVWLKEQCQTEFQVRILSQGKKPLRPEETKLLALRSGQWAWVRETELICDGEVWIKARSVFPDKSLQGKGKEFRELGTRPLIELLQTDPHLKRSPFSIAKIRLKEGASQWARRSIFSWYGKPILVQEIFLRFR